jgi:hypothetical protein
MTWLLLNQTTLSEIALGRVRLLKSIFNYYESICHIHAYTYLLFYTNIIAGDGQVECLRACYGKTRYK